MEKLEAGSYDLCLASFNMDFTPDPGFYVISGNTGNYTRYKKLRHGYPFDELRKTMNGGPVREKLGAIQDLFFATSLYLPVLPQRRHPHPAHVTKRPGWSGARCCAASKAPIRGAKRITWPL